MLNFPPEDTITILTQMHKAFVVDHLETWINKTLYTYSFLTKVVFSDPSNKIVGKAPVLITAKIFEEEKLVKFDIS